MDYRRMQIYLTALELDKADLSLLMLSRRCRYDPGFWDNPIILKALKQQQGLVEEYQKWTGEGD